MGEYFKIKLLTQDRSVKLNDVLRQQEHFVYKTAVHAETGSPVVAEWVGENVGTTIARVKLRS